MNQHSPMDARPSSGDDSHADTTRDLVQLCLLPGLGPRTLASLLDAFGSARAILNAGKANLSQVHGVGPKLAHVIETAADHVDIEDVFAWCAAHDVDIRRRGETSYLPSLLDLDDAPPIMFCRGHLLPRDSVSVAIVGTRHATAYGLQQTRRIAMDLARAGVTIVSGLARGVDTAAHRGALEADGRTIAVLGGGLGKIYPAENAPLADEIAQSGAVLSEYSPQAQPRGGMFPQRNRIIAALGQATLVIEAPNRSGSLITARLASEMGRTVGALPGQVNSRASQGCHHLIRDGATLVQHAEDVLELLGPLSAPVSESTATEDETPIRDAREMALNEIERQVLAAVGTTGTALDEVTHHSGLPASRVNAIVSILEMKRFVRRLSGQYVSRI
ncbi:DNA-processing protein DprA [Rhodopirellula halodulae]|uniref:DNA-processing protein DprA n=1 Tax=Rhodopirellula halodulae TaxID=2894198 RepID=UPI001E5F713E|nr:DNA-processing protein DprA [Rhodopirellula sp. JC737]MCC9654471.1 DNA-processing protein DprA [Rhodopirellula sp. JC737]